MLDRHVMEVRTLIMRIDEREGDMTDPRTRREKRATAGGHEATQATPSRRKSPCLPQPAALDKTATFF